MIEGLLQLPVMEMRTPHKMAADEDPLRRRLWIKGKAREHALQSDNNKSARATLILDLMEPFHELTGAVYAALIASHGEDASAEQDGDAATATVCRQQAWRSAKAALQLLNRSEDFYLETGRAAAHLPTVTSYATVMDVWKALAVDTLAVDVALAAGYSKQHLKHHHILAVPFANLQYSNTRNKFPIAIMSAFSMRKTKRLVFLILLYFELQKLH